MMKRPVAEIIHDNPGIDLARCDVEKSSEHIERFDIQGAPALTFMLYGEIKSAISGFRNRAAQD